MRKISGCGHVLQTTQNLVNSRCCFAEDGKEMYTDLERTCTAIVLLFKPFVLWRSRYRYRRVLRKVPNIQSYTDNMASKKKNLMYSCYCTPCR